MLAEKISTLAMTLTQTTAPKKLNNKNLRQLMRRTPARGPATILIPAMKRATKIVAARARKQLFTPGNDRRANVKSFLISLESGVHHRSRWQIPGYLPASRPERHQNDPRQSKLVFGVSQKTCKQQNGFAWNRQSSVFQQERGSHRPITVVDEIATQKFKEVVGHVQAGGRYGDKNFKTTAANSSGTSS